MPFSEITSGPNKGKYRSPSGRIFTKKQVALYYKTGGTFRDIEFIVDVASNFVCEDTAKPLLECGCGRTHLDDAALRARRDPTRTLDLRRKFIRDLERRWRKLSFMVTDAIVQQDMFGLASGNTRALQFIAMSSGRVNMFQNWIDAALADTILGMDRENWVRGYIETAYKRGWDVAKSQLGREVPLNEDRAAIVTKLTITELQGVIEAFSQRAVRAFSDGLLSHLPPAKIARSIRQVVMSIGVVRSRATVQTMIVRANGEAALDYFQAAQVKLVGVVPETVPSPGRQHAIRDAARKRRARKRRVELVNVLTAGDDLVCQICEDIADDNPYTIDEARGLIPAHPNCRCAFVPLDDARFAAGDAAPELDPVVELNNAYRLAKGDMKVGNIYRDPREGILARDLQLLDVEPGLSIWEIDITDIENAEADEASVYLPAGTEFEVTGFDEKRKVWLVKAK